MANQRFKLGVAADTSAYKVAGTQLGSWTGVGGPACSSVAGLTTPFSVSTGDLDKICYGTPEFDLPVPNGTYDIIFITHGNHNRRVWVDGVEKTVSDWNPYTANGNTNQADEFIVSGYVVTGNECTVKITSPQGSGNDVISEVHFIDVSGGGTGERIRFQII